jgi:hypothetical protein
MKIKLHRLLRLTRYWDLGGGETFKALNEIKISRFLHFPPLSLPFMSQRSAPVRSQLTKTIEP